MRHGSEGAPLPAPSPQWHWWHAVWTSGKICHPNSPVAIVARFSHLIITLNALPPKGLHWRPSRERERERECECLCETTKEEMDLSEDSVSDRGVSYKGILWAEITN